MKKLLSIYVFTLITNLLLAQVSKTIHVETPGTLSTLVLKNEMNRLKSLTLSGNIDVRDIKYIQSNIASYSIYPLKPILLEVYLDFSDVTIFAYTGSEGTYHYFDYTNTVFSYPANEFPEYSFSNFVTGEGFSPYKTIKLPKTITSIGNYAFFGCDGLSLVYSYTLNPVTVGISSFYGVSCTLYIPNGSTANYENSIFRNKFPFVIEMISTDIPTLSYNKQPIKIYTENSKIIIDGTSIGETVKLYMANGKQITNLISKGKKIILPVDRNTVYVVKTATKTFKVIM